MPSTESKSESARIREMLSPVVCAHCNAIYDLCGAHEQVARYADCDVFKSPCCGRTVDTRPWKGMPDYDRVTRREAKELRADGYIVHHRVVS